MKYNTLDVSHIFIEMKLLICVVACLYLFDLCGAVEHQGEHPGKLGDCPDGYWDCLYTDDDDHVQHSLGGFNYGRCMNYAKGKCLPCQHQLWDDPDVILAKCNMLVPECLGRCTIYADLYSCCYLGHHEQQAGQLSGSVGGGGSVHRRVLESGKVAVGDVEGHATRKAAFQAEAEQQGSSAVKERERGALPDLQSDIAGVGSGDRVKVDKGVCGNLPPEPQAKQEACGF